MLTPPAKSRIFLVEMRKEPRELRTDWPEGTTFAFCGDDDTPLASVRGEDGLWRTFLPDGSPRVGGTCATIPGPLSREEFDKEAAVWAARD